MSGQNRSKDHRTLMARIACGTVFIRTPSTTSSDLARVEAQACSQISRLGSAARCCLPAGNIA
jgi:hypothetical protein